MTSSTTTVQNYDKDTEKCKAMPHIVVQSHSLADRLIIHIDDNEVLE